MERVEITRHMIGICHMQVCAVKDATHEEILEVANRENPSGTSQGWTEVLDENYKYENARPGPCDDDPDRIHYLLVC